MKKAALTFGLFSLVMVATSFSTPETTSSLAISDSIKTISIDGNGAVGKTKKPDFHGSYDQLNTNRQLNFASVNQSIGTDKKVD